MTRLGLNAGGVYTAALHRHPDAHALLETPLPEDGTDLQPEQEPGSRPGGGAVNGAQPG